MYKIVRVKRLASILVLWHIILAIDPKYRSVDAR